MKEVAICGNDIFVLLQTDPIGFSLTDKEENVNFQQY